MSNNWNDIAARDAHLRRSIDASSEALARHRYEHTIAAGVSFREYARKCGLTEAQVRKYATAHEVRGSAPQDVPMDVALVRAGTTVDRADVVEAIAEARGLGVATIDRHHRDEVRRVLGAARERSEEQGTTVREEAGKIAAMTVRLERAVEDQRRHRLERVDLRYVELERHIGAARRALVHALRVPVELPDEHRDLIAQAIGVVRDLLALIDARFVGLSEADWDRELATILDGTPT